MDADRFESMLRSLATTPSRRNALRVLAGSALGGLFGLGHLQAKAKKGGKGKGGKGKNKKCKNKGKTKICHQGQTITVSNCALKAHQRHGDTRGPCPTCSDGIQNGSETGVDCGGTCPRCPAGQGCASRDDCASALCSGGTCQTCTGASGECGNDANGACLCAAGDPPGPLFCRTNSGRLTNCPTTPCPAGEICDNTGAISVCTKPCGAA